MPGLVPGAAGPFAPQGSSRTSWHHPSNDTADDVSARTGEISALDSVAFFP